MKLSLRYFILACLLLGAIGVPWAWRAYQAKRLAEMDRLEIKRLEAELAESQADLEREISEGTPFNVQTIRRYRRIDQLCDSLEELTSVRPSPEMPFDERRINTWDKRLWAEFTKEAKARSQESRRRAPDWRMDREAVLDVVDERDQQ